MQLFANDKSSKGPLAAMVAMLIFLSVPTTNVFSQCTDISIGKKQIDSVLTREYANMDADTFLVINYGNTFLKYQGWAIVAKVRNGKMEAYKYRLRKNDRISKKEIRRKSVLALIDSFFTEQYWKISDNIYYDPKIIVFHASELKIHYFDKNTNWCKYFKNLNGFTEESNNDERVIWLKKLVDRI